MPDPATLASDIVSGMREWRAQHPAATFREIEAAVAERLAPLQAALLQEAASTSPAADWTAAPAPPACPHCGAPCTPAASTPAICKRPGAARSSSPASMPPARPVAPGFSPLDEALALPAGRFTPQLLEWMSVWGPGCPSRRPPNC